MNKIQNDFSPYDINPQNHNTFKDFIHKYFDFDLIKQSKEYPCSKMKSNTLR